MVLELAILDVIPGSEGEFEQAFSDARGIIAAMPGFLSLELQKCIERENRYALDPRPIVQVRDGWLATFSKTRMENLKALRRIVEKGAG